MSASNSESREQIIEVARKILDGTLPLLEGVRSLYGLRSRLSGPEPEAFMVIRSIESETDHLPARRNRHQFAEDYLLKADQEAAELMSASRMDILQACEEIVAFYGDTKS